MRRGPHTMPMLEPVFEHSFVNVAVLPIVFPIPVRSIALVLAFEKIPVGECLDSIAVLDKLFELSFVLLVFG